MRRRPRIPRAVFTTSTLCSRTGTACRLAPTHSTSFRRFDWQLASPTPSPHPTSVCLCMGLSREPPWPSRKASKAAQPVKAVMYAARLQLAASRSTTAPEIVAVTGRVTPESVAMCSRTAMPLPGVESSCCTCWRLCTVAAPSVVTPTTVVSAALSAAWGSPPTTTD